MYHVVIGSNSFSGFDFTMFLLKKNQKVIKLAKKVKKQSNVYKRQLKRCKNTLTTKKYIIF